MKCSKSVVLGKIDHEKPRVVNEAPTLMRISIRIALTSVASYNLTICFPRNTLAFSQSKDELNREVRDRMPKGENKLELMGAPFGSILKAVKLRNGLAESHGYLCHTFRQWHAEDLKMETSA